VAWIDRLWFPGWPPPLRHRDNGARRRTLRGMTGCVATASMETSVHVLVECERLSIELLAKPQPKASANSKQLCGQ
jgi:hypothetical protein